MIKNIILGLIIACSFTSNVFANDYREIQLIQQAKITLAKAIEIAEKSLPGKAISAEIDDDMPTPVYKVKVTKDNMVYKVRVDGTTGAVISTILDD